MAAGSISVERFNTDVASFMEVSSLNNDTWFCQGLKNDPKTKFLVKKTTRSTDVLHQGGDECQGNTVDINDEIDDWDDMVLQPQDSGEVNTTEVETRISTWEYHIVYSPSYGVPVLYFNATWKDGRLLTLEEVWKSVPHYYQERLQHEKWSFITQQEHPLLQRPFFQLHPCHTSTLMDQVLGTDLQERNYLLTWLSSVGPVVHLVVPLSYFQTPHNSTRTESDTTDK